MRTLGPGWLAVWPVVWLVACNSAREPMREQPPPAVAASQDARPADAPELAAEQVPPTAPARRLWTARIDDQAAFESFSAELGGERFAKFVIDLKSDAIYYFDVNVYKVHKDFIFQELYKKPKTKQAVRVFDRNYGA